MVGARQDPKYFGHSSKRSKTLYGLLSIQNFCISNNDKENR